MSSIARTLQLCKVGRLSLDELMEWLSCVFYLKAHKYCRDVTTKVFVLWLMCFNLLILLMFHSIRPGLAIDAGSTVSWALRSHLPKGVPPHSLNNPLRTPPLHSPQRVQNPTPLRRVKAANTMMKCLSVYQKVSVPSDVSWYLKRAG